MLSVILMGLLVPLAVDEPQAADLAPTETYTPDQREHWAFQRIQRPEVPEVRCGSWIRNPIDAFILSGLETIEVDPSPEADRVALIRRVTFDLTGLPPTTEEVEAFLIDHRPDAYERLVDRLLDSPQYGERWAQHWLDLSHYADSNGFELDADRPDAWRYRDWVVRALNNDMPYDRFLTLQIAGDEVSPGDPAALIATGFGRCGPREVVAGNIDPVVRRQSELTEVTGTVGSVFLGLTLACARCHDHKFDPIPTTDYYRLQAFFEAAQFVDLPIASRKEQEAYEAAKKAIERRIAPLKKELADLEAPYRVALRAEKEALLTEAERTVLAIPASDRTAAQKKIAEGAAIHLKISWEEVAAAVAKNPNHHHRRENLKRRIFDVEQTLPLPPAKAMALVDQSPTAPPTRVYRRGNPKDLGPQVEPRPPGILLSVLPEGAFQADQIQSTSQTTGRRLALARWLTHPDHPLTSRVLVNRLWQHHFGRGIVTTPSDFGVRGEVPTHPELLDWLACELIAQNWRLKPLHRLMVTSATYRQASNSRHGQEADPENLTLWRMNRRRLEAESLRDALLAVSGELNPKMEGPGVLVPIEQEVEELIFTEAEIVDLWPENPDPTEHNRRSLYLFRKRNVRYPLFDAFDAPDTQSVCSKRSVSTHAPQALVLLNSEFAVNRSRALAGRVLLADPAGGETAIQTMYQIALARDPSPEELAQATSFLKSQADFLTNRSRDSLLQPSPFSPHLNPQVQAAWVDLALAMINRNEFLYIP